MDASQENKFQEWLANMHSCGLLLNLARKHAIKAYRAAMKLADKIEVCDEVEQ